MLVAYVHCGTEERLIICQCVCRPDLKSEIHQQIIKSVELWCGKVATNPSVQTDIDDATNIYTKYCETKGYTAAAADNQQSSGGESLFIIFDMARIVG